MLRIMVRRSSQICGLQSGSANKNIAFDHRLFRLRIMVSPLFADLQCTVWSCK